MATSRQPAARSGAMPARIDGRRPAVPARPCDPRSRHAATL